MLLFDRTNTKKKKKVDSIDFQVKQFEKNFKSKNAANSRFRVSI